MSDRPPPPPPPEIIVDWQGHYERMTEGVYEQVNGEDTTHIQSALFDYLGDTTLPIYSNVQYLTGLAAGLSIATQAICDPELQVLIACEQEGCPEGRHVWISGEVLYRICMVSMHAAMELHRTAGALNELEG